MSLNRTIAICSGVALGIAGIAVWSGVTNPKQLIPASIRASGPEYFVSPSTGVSIYTREWIAPNAKASVVLVHGFGEHCGRYEYFARRLNREGYSVFALDHQGHGRSEGLPGYVERFSHYADDVIHFVDIVQRKYPNIPLHIVGHSMGGAVTSLVVLREPHRFTSVVLSAPAIIPLPEVAKPHLVFLANTLSNVVPRLPFEKLNASLVSRDPAVVQDYITDPYNYHGGMRVRWGAEILHTMDFLQNNVANIRNPLLVMTGSDDKLVNPEGARYVYDNSLSEDKRFLQYPGLYHEIFNEPERDTVIGNLLDWLNAHTAK